VDDGNVTIARGGGWFGGGGGQDGAPSTFGEGKGVEVIHAGLPVVAAKDVQGVVEDGGGVEGALARGGGGGEVGGGFDEGPAEGLV